MSSTRPTPPSRARPRSRRRRRSRAAAKRLRGRDRRVHAATRRGGQRAAGQRGRAFAGAGGRRHAAPPSFGGRALCSPRRRVCANGTCDSCAFLSPFFRRIIVWRAPPCSSDVVQWPGHFQVFTAPSFQACVSWQSACFAGSGSSSCIVCWLRRQQPAATCAPHSDLVGCMPPPAPWRGPLSYCASHLVLHVGRAAERVVLHLPLGQGDLPAACSGALGVCISDDKCEVADDYVVFMPRALWVACSRACECWRSV